METDRSGIILILILVVFIIYFCFMGTRSGFTFKFYKTPSKKFQGVPQRDVFSNADYQTYPPSVNLQSDYYTCIAQVCGGNTFDYPCLEKCHLKAFRKHMRDLDHADLVCYDKRFKPEDYYKCLDRVYTDYKYP